MFNGPKGLFNILLYVKMFESEELEKIFQSELELGNSIEEERSWPPECTKFVLLENFFLGEHELSENVLSNDYRDPHYWYVEYSTKNGKERLSSKKWESD
jgi:hypothetical protein